MTWAGRVMGRAIGLPGRAAAEIRAATALLTRIPIGASDPGATGAAAFGFVGGLVGATGAIVLLVLGERAPLAAGGLAVGATALVSGALHLDGLADTADALAAPTAEAATAARKDPRVGSAGAVAIALVILVDASLLAALATRGGSALAAFACIVATAGSRAVPPIVAEVIRRPAPGSGLGRWFAERVGMTAALCAAGSAATIGASAALVLGRPILLVAITGGMALTLAVAVWLAGARQGIDGDGFGALVEVAFALVLLITALGL
jgi:adenosylcobinamide-GDP ribazoletransferase